MMWLQCPMFACSLSIIDRGNRILVIFILLPSFMTVTWSALSLLNKFCLILCVSPCSPSQSVISSIFYFKFYFGTSRFTNPIDLS